MWVLKLQSWTISKEYVHFVKNQAQSNTTAVSLKSLIATVLFLVLISPPVLVNLCFLAKKNAIRKTIRENLIHNLTDSDLVVLTFTKANAQKELHWEHQDEFEYRGKMYDVVRYKEEGNLIHYWCWPDEPESNLNQKLISLTAKLLNQAPEPKHQGEKLVVNAVVSSKSTKEYLPSNFLAIYTHFVP